MEHLTTVKGMNDLLPEEIARWHYVENCIIQQFSAFGYQEIRTPIIEKTALFLRSIGQVTDIVQKEMYTFEDRNQESLTLRPEGTASVVRALLQHNLLGKGQTQKVWYRGPMYRYERPQRGRYRQFYQMGIEAFNFPGPDLDIELIILCHRLWQVFGIQNITLEINSLGKKTEREAYKKVLVEYFNDHQAQLDEDSKIKLAKNPLRILDSKNKDLQELINNAPKLLDFLGQQSLDFFQQYQAWLNNLRIEFSVNPRLVRGLDYYSDVVFEWVTDELGAQNAICSGGRYDSLVEELGGKNVPAAGFAIGLERLIELIDDNSFPENTSDVYMVLLGDNAKRLGFHLVRELRRKLNDVQIICNLNGGSIKTQLRRANKLQAKYAVIIGDEEIETRYAILKPLLRGDDKQESVLFRDLANRVAELLDLSHNSNLQ